MSLDFGKLQNDIASGNVLEPRKIFTTLQRDPRFRRPSDEQAEVLDAWFAQRPQADTTIKMNTGAGKTLVGLLALQSSLNEGILPAAYVTPDNYLLDQVIAEANTLGIQTVKDPRDPKYLSGQAILVVNIYKIINGKSVFGVSHEGIKIPIGAMVIDDAHACLSTVATQFSMEVKADHELYKYLYNIFQTSLRQQSLAKEVELAEGASHIVSSVPFWSWIEHQPEVVKAIVSHKDDEDIMFRWPLLSEVLELCQCVFSGTKLEITPRCIPIDAIPAFSRAKRRIYMTATLADDGILISHFGADASAILSPITPKGAGDIGDRMILAPQEINPQITDEEVKQLVSNIAQTQNVAVIVPSHTRAGFWQDVSHQILDKTNIATGVANMRAGLVGLTVFINKYDGVDLPGNACRLLVIDGLPEVYTLAERLEMALLDGTEVQLLNQIQRIEQGMGRGVRSSEDYCCIVLLGGRLTQRIHLKAARDKFSPATLAQIDLGKAVTEQLRGKPLNEIAPTLNYCLSQDSQWLNASRSALVNAPERETPYINPYVVKIREAFEAARDQRYDVACGHIQDAANQAAEPITRGYLLQILASYQHKISPAQAQETLLTARKLNRQVLTPLSGVQYSKLLAPAQGQAATAIQYMSKFENSNDLIIFINSILEELAWDPQRTNRFENALQEIGHLLGFGSQRPELEIGDGPDNLWAIGQGDYLVIECKSGATSGIISKKNCNQLLGSISWFKTRYANESATPVMVHPRNHFDHYSAPTPDFRIIDENCLERLKTNISLLGTSISSNACMGSPQGLAELLTHFKFTRESFIASYTTGYTVDKS
ncbi:MULTISPECIES: helicase C-terminal domain-containing protein [unclassified Pseudodesulfovibrio]|uniref:helicase C-terminal domain-containing protein n=1 Tax=unclassified Pseudodesulfovibrio TaxID=2661612 RepID=UPI000FEB773E|nr:MULTISPECIES: helicase C-terminal domain-containing protein [unclassified Pseudodesulfovibrio]MCJ2163564.1 hypothetical protein [Pseudodesulfovibrio sp. S3-i]RWU06800.1 hypothetical protein DWB63_03275 [Pseudodesulfovibrio sp. S3]